MSYAHQDWKTVVLNPSTHKQKPNPSPKQHGAAVSITTNKPAWKIEQQVDSETGKPINRVKKEDADFIKQQRIECRLSQQQLAQALNMKLVDIQEIECCKAFENKAVLSRIKQFFLKRKVANTTSH